MTNLQSANIDVDDPARRVIHLLVIPDVIDVTLGVNRMYTGLRAVVAPADRLAGAYLALSHVHVLHLVVDDLVTLHHPAVIEIEAIPAPDPLLSLDAEDARDLQNIPVLDPDLVQLIPKTNHPHVNDTLLIAHLHHLDFDLSVSISYLELLARLPNLDDVRPLVRLPGRGPGLGLELGLLGLDLDLSLRLRIAIEVGPWI